MAMETAAAILTRVAFEQNLELKARLSAFRGKEKDVVALIMPLFRQVLAELERAKQAHDKFPSAIPAPSSSRMGTVGQSDVEASHDEERHEHHEDDDIGGES